MADRIENIKGVGKLLDAGATALKEKHIDFVGRAETSNAVRMARDYIDSLSIEVRMLDADPATTEAEFFGETFSTPVMPAPLSGLGGVWPDGLVEIAKAAVEANTVMWIGIGGEKEMADVAATGAKFVKIIKPYANHDVIIEKIRLAEKYNALAVGIDTVFGYGAKKGDTLIMPKPLAPVSTAELVGYVDATRLPFVVKGVLSVRDAKKAKDAGAAAIVVSSHSGSVLDYAVPPLQVLPEIFETVGGGMSIFIDGGFARGTDAFKALALGADGVLFGRNLIRALAVGGSETALAYLTGVTEELKRVMNLTDSPSPQEIDSSTIRGQGRNA
ncbi:MAG: alpha-hydroxy-acid oxidizing protein [Clostridiales Family XIII bacterium]|jgi:isopentenyl diphosphate isomerase/L-lactate dehydrogenase-like FMN-dependent dehydrogenase|nr:alpha-hydroxy-acid oxidizing protein [Clostridiales Family XIII bacterium]